MGELLDLLAEAVPGGRLPRFDGPRAHHLERLGDGAMEEPAARGEQPTIRDIPDPIVGEVQLVSHGLEHVVADHLLDRLRRVAFLHPAGGLESVKSNWPR